MVREVEWRMADGGRGVRRVADGRLEAGDVRRMVDGRRREM